MGRLVLSRLVVSKGDHCIPILCRSTNVTISWLFHVVVIEKTVRWDRWRHGLISVWTKRVFICNSKTIHWFGCWTQWRERREFLFSSIKHNRQHYVCSSSNVFPNSSSVHAELYPTICLLRRVDKVNTSPRASSKDAKPCEFILR